MNNSHNEDKLNPPPYRYKVSNLTKIIFIIIFLLGVIGYFYMIIDRRISQRKFMLENQIAAIRLAPIPVPELIFAEPMSGNLININNYAGQWILLNIWATWCPTCQEEMPSLELLHKQLDNKIKIIAISVDESKEALVSFVNTHKPKFTILHDNQQISPKIFNISKYPETFLISPAGILSAQLSGPRDWSSPAMIKYLLDLISK